VVIAVWLIAVNIAQRCAKNRGSNRISEKLHYQQLEGAS